MGTKEQPAPGVPASPNGFGATHVFTIPDRSRDTAGSTPDASIIAVTPPFRVFCGRMKDPETGTRHHGLWLTQRPDISVRDVVDARKDWLLLDFGTQLISPMWQQAQSYVEYWLLQQVALQLAAGYRNINVIELVAQLLGNPASR